MPPVDVLEVSDGQDRGARFGLPGARAEIGRGPTVDLMLTDPHVAARHAELCVDGRRLLLADLGGAGGTSLNGVPVRTPTPLAVGDLLRVGETVLRVLWTPDGAPPPPPPPPGRGGRDPGRVPPARAAPAITLRPSRPPARRVPMAALVAAGGLLAALLCLVATGLPAVARDGAAASLWTVDPAPLRPLAVACAALAVAAAAAWLGAECTAARAAARGALAAAAAGAAGLAAGVPLTLAVAPGYDARPGLALATVAALALAVAGIWRVGALAEARGATAPPRDPRALLVMAGAAGALVTALSAPAPWTAGPRDGLAGIDGLDPAIGVGRWLVPLALATAGACAVAGLAGRVADRRSVATAAAVALALAAATLAFTVASAATLDGAPLAAGMVAALAGAALGVVPCAAGAVALAAGPPASPPSGGARHSALG